MFHKSEFIKHLDRFTHTPPLTQPLIHKHTQAKLMVTQNHYFNSYLLFTFLISHNCPLFCGLMLSHVFPPQTRFGSRVGSGMLGYYTEGLDFDSRLRIKNPVITRSLFPCEVMTNQRVASQPNSRS